jgi:YggT family protein
MADAVQLVNLAYQALNVLILARIVLSWVPGVGGDHPVVRVVHRLTAPILEPIRRLMPPVGGLDLSPLVAILLLYLVRDLLVSLLWSL